MAERTVDRKLRWVEIGDRLAILKPGHVATMWGVLVYHVGADRYVVGDGDVVKVDGTTFCRHDTIARVLLLGLGLDPLRN